jgi:hypothetical protein
MITKTRIKYFAGAIASVITVAFVLNEYSVYKRKLNYASQKLNADNKLNAISASSKNKL